MFMQSAKGILFVSIWFCIQALSMEASRIAQLLFLKDPGAAQQSESLAQNQAFDSVVQFYFSHDQGRVVYNPASELKANIHFSGNNDQPGTILRIPLGFQTHRHQQTGIIFHPKGILTPASSLHKSLFHNKIEKFLQR